MTCNVCHVIQKDTSSYKAYRFDIAFTASYILLTVVGRLLNVLAICQ